MESLWVYGSLIHCKDCIISQILDIEYATCSGHLELLFSRTIGILLFTCRLLLKACLRKRLEA
jgi:hypothetical protein